MSTYVKFRRQMPIKKLLYSVEESGWKLSDDGQRLEKVSVVHLDRKGSKVKGFTRYGLNDCESLFFLGD